MSKRQRRFMNFFLAPREQLFFSLRMIFGVLVLSQLQTMLSANISGSESFFLRSLLLFALSATLIGVYTMVVTHRVFGPVRAMEIYVDKLIAGEADRPLTLRTTDYFSPLAGKLSELRTRLEHEAGRKSEAGGDQKAAQPD